MTARIPPLKAEDPGEESSGFDFSAVIANSVHDMKNSLSMVVGGLESLMDQCRPENCPAHEGLSQLRYEGNRINQQLIQLLVLYRMQNNRYLANITEHSVDEILEECRLENEGLLALHGFSIDVAPMEETYWYFDRALITSVLNSTVNNAYKYARDRVELSASERDGYLGLHVRDNGNGYPPEMLTGEGDNQFDINPENRSTGLGLYFTSLVARSHTNRDRHGYIEMSNDGLDGGGCMSIWLP